jgi:MFS family permease
LSRSVSSIGDGIALIALVLYVKATERSGIAVAALLLAQALPHLLGPVTGTLVDRVNIKRLMVACEIGQAIIFTAVALWQPPFVALLFLVVTASVLDTTFGPASGSAVPALVSAPDLMQANAWLGTSLNLQVAIGPLLGGALAAGLGPRWALAANALSFAVSAALLAGLPKTMRVAARSGAGVLSDGLAGLRFAWKQPAVRSLMLGTFLLVAFVAVDNVALVFLTRDVLGLNAFGFGAVAATFGVGMLAGSVVLSWMRSVPRSAPLLLSAWLMSGVSAIATGLAPNAGIAAGAQSVGGLGNGIGNVASSTLIQQLVPREMLGRAFGLFGTAASAGSALAYTLAGVLLDLTSPRVTFVVGGIGALAVLLVFGPTLWRAASRRTV